MCSATNEHPVGVRSWRPLGLASLSPVGCTCRMYLHTTTPNTYKEGSNDSVHAFFVFPGCAYILLKPGATESLGSRSLPPEFGPSPVSGPLAAVFPVFSSLSPLSPPLSPPCVLPPHRGERYLGLSDATAYKSGEQDLSQRLHVNRGCPRVARPVRRLSGSKSSFDYDFFQHVIGKHTLLLKPGYLCHKLLMQ